MLLNEVNRFLSTKWWQFQNRYAIDFRIMGGFMSATMPSVSLTDIATGDNITQAKTSATAFAYDFGANLRWNVSTKVCLIIGIDYLSSNPNFIINGTIDGVSQPTTTQNQQFGIVTSTLGIGLIIDKK